MDDQRTDREGGQVGALRSVVSIVSGLMVVSGASIIVITIPLGLLFALDWFWGDWLWAATFFLVWAAASAAVGGGVLALGFFLCRWEGGNKKFPTT